jgi:hypothetical protein
MAKYSKKQNQISDKTLQEAEKLAKGIQKPGQTKEQTKLVTQGIAKGIELYKKQQKAKARDQNKSKKKQIKASKKEVTVTEASQTTKAPPQNRLPWLLLVISWLGFAGLVAIYLG